MDYPSRALKIAPILHPFRKLPARHFFENTSREKDVEDEKHLNTYWWGRIEKENQPRKLEIHMDGYGVNQALAESLVKLRFLDNLGADGRRYFCPQIPQVI